MVLFGYRYQATDFLMDPLGYQVDPVDVTKNFNAEKDRITLTEDGAYFFSFSVGVPAAVQVNCTIKTVGNPPVFEWASLIRNHINTVGEDTMSRDALLYMGAGTSLSLASRYPVHSSYAEKITSVSGFSISQIMQPERHYFMVAKTTGQTGPGQNITFNIIQKNQGEGYKVSSQTYVCPVNGYYVFSLSVYIAGQQTVVAEIRNKQEVFELRRTHQNHKTGGDTLSRTIMTYCVVNTPVYVFVRSGRVDGQADLATSFSGFLYNPYLPTADKCAWFLSTNGDFVNDFSQELSLPFTKALVAIGMGNSLRGSNIVEVVCPYDGLYFLHLTLVAKANKKVSAVIYNIGRYTDIVAGIRRDGDNVWHGEGEDTLSRSVIVKCAANNRLVVKIHPDTAVGAGSSDSVVSTAFLGFQLLNGRNDKAGDTFQ